MNEEIKKKIMEYFETLEVTAGRFSDLAQQEIPLVLQEYLNWTFYSNLFLGTVWGITFLVLSVIFWRLSCYAKESRGSESPEYCMSIVVTIWSAFMSVGVSCGYMYECIKVSVAPRVVILEIAKQFLN